MEKRRILYISVSLAFVLLAIFATSTGMFTQNAGIINPSFEAPLSAGWIIVNADSGISAEQSGQWVSDGDRSLRFFGISTGQNNIDVIQELILSNRVDMIAVDVRSENLFENEGHRIGLCIYKPNERCIFSPERNEPAQGKSGTHTLRLNVPLEYRNVPAKLILRTAITAGLGIHYYWDNARTI